jgi:CBS domain-containing protein
MEIESLEIFQYLTSCDPIAKLDRKAQQQLALNTEIIYIKRDQVILEPGENNQWLYLIRSGAVERTNKEGSIAAQFAEKDFFGQASLKRGGLIERKVQAIEDTLLYRFPKHLFFQQLESNPYFQFYFERGSSDSHDFHQDSGEPTSNFNYAPVSSLLHEKPLLVDHKISVSECAKIMQSTGSTSLLVTQKDQVKGIVTDRAFCTKIVADNLSHESPVGLIMSDQLLTTDEQTTASEALLIMARNNIRHLPVTSEEQVIGVLTATDLIHRQSNNPIYLINQIYKAKDIERLVMYAKQIPQTLCRLVKNAHSAKDIGYSISSIGRAINQQLIKLAEQELGAPPVKYAWIIAGSLARNDQTARSDQDNGLILDDSYDSEKHQNYFSKLSQFVCDGLNECGYINCPGDVMATNSKWQQNLSTWKKYFREWILTPEPKALMYASIFFDLRCIYGECSLLNELNQFVREFVVENPSFLNFMASNALQHTPPLGLFRSFVLEKHGSEEKALNMKKRGVVPITDLARVYALSCGAHPINTQERLQIAFQKEALSKSGVMDLNDAFEFLSQIRLTHQARQIENGIDADNYLPPEELSSLERRHLKDAFEIIRTYQKALASSYQTGFIG